MALASSPARVLHKLVEEATTSDGEIGKVRMSHDVVGDGESTSTSKHSLEVYSNDYQDGMATVGVDNIDTYITDATDAMNINPLPPCVANMLECAENLTASAVDSWNLLVAEHNCQEAIYIQCFDRDCRFKEDTWSSYVTRLNNIYLSTRDGGCAACITLLRPIYQWILSADLAANITPTYLAFAPQMRTRVGIASDQVRELYGRLDAYVLPNLERLRVNEDLDRQVWQRHELTDRVGASSGDQRQGHLGPTEQLELSKTDDTKPLEQDHPGPFRGFRHDENGQQIVEPAAHPVESVHAYLSVAEQLSAPWADMVNWEA